MILCFFLQIGTYKAIIIIIIYSDDNSIKLVFTIVSNPTIGEVKETYILCQVLGNIIYPYRYPIIWQTRSKAQLILIFIISSCSNAD